MPKAAIPFGAWEPDKAPHGHNGLTRADNVYPIANGYEPVRAFLAATTALDGWSGGGAFISAGGTSYLLGGADDGLYVFDGADWNLDTAVSAGRWRFSQNRALVVGVHGGAPLAFDLATGSGGALGGSPPDAAYTATVGDFTFLAGDPADITTGSWSGFANAEQWTPGTNQAGSLTLPDGGAITGLAGGDIGLVFQRGAIHRFDYIGEPTVWQRTKISSEVGCIAPGSIVQAGRQVFFLSERGFMMCDGQDVRPIGSERVDRTFFRTYERAELGNIYAATDPRHFLVAWTMPGNPGQVWLYNWALDRWANVRFPLFGTFSGFTSNIAADSVDGLYPGGADAIDLPMDSPVFAGGEPRIYYVTAAGVLGTLTGETLEAYFETPLNELVQGQRVRAQRLRPVSDALAVTVRVDARQLLGGGGALTITSEYRGSGDVPFRANGLFYKFGLVIPAGAAWTFAQGIEVEFGSGGRR